MTDETRRDIEAAAFRRLLEHLRENDDVQNIDLMITANFCRNCISRWVREEAVQLGEALSDDAAREWVYGMPYSEWKANQPAATPEQLAAYEARTRKA
jgi:hypothetical protein